MNEVTMLFPDSTTMEQVARAIEEKRRLADVEILKFKYNQVLKTMEVKLRIDKWAEAY